MNIRALSDALVALLVMPLFLGCFYVVEPGERGVRVTIVAMPARN